jgi:hypothetical protein
MMMLSSILLKQLLKKKRRLSKERFVPIVVSGFLFLFLSKGKKMKPPFRPLRVICEEC